MRAAARRVGQYMRFVRFFALFLLVLALMLVGADMMSSLEKGDMVMRALEHDLALLGADPVPWLDATLDKSVAGVIETVLSWPGWAILGVLGLAIGALTLGAHEDDED